MISLFLSFFCLTLFPELYGVAESVQVSSSPEIGDDFGDGVTGSTVPDRDAPSTRSISEIGAMIIGGFEVCSLPKT